MIWQILVISLGLVSARERVDPEHLRSLRESGQHEEFARLLGVDVSLVHENTEARSEDIIRFNNVSPLGDILLPEEDERQGINLDRYPGSRWPNNQIPVAFQTKDFTSDELTFIINACRDWNKKVKNLKLVDHAGQEDYVMVISGNGCYSYLGRVGGQQALSLQRTGCLSNGTVQHEFMHAAGFAHEHNREDRDKFVKVLWNNIPQKWQSQYDKVNSRDYINIGDYGYDSVMHYPIWAPENYDYDAFEILTKGVSRESLGQDVGLSDNDIEKINYLYRARR